MDLSCQHNSNIIPGKLETASATRNPGILRLLDARFREHNGKTGKKF